MTRIKIHISNVKLPFYPPCEVKCGLQNRVSTALSKYSATNVSNGEGSIAWLVVMASKILLAHQGVNMSCWMEF